MRYSEMTKDQQFTIRRFEQQLRRDEFKKPITFGGLPNGDVRIVDGDSIEIAVFPKNFNPLELLYPETRSLAEAQLAEMEKRGLIPKED